MKSARTLIDAKEVSRIIGLSRTTIWRLEQAGNFPKRVTIGERCVRWAKDEIDSWVEARIEQRGWSA